MGASGLSWSGMPYRDLGRSPPKTLGRPTGRVKGFCVPSCVPNSPVRGVATVRLCGNGSPELGRRRRSRTEPRPATIGRMEAFSTDVARSLRPASMARCTGSSGGFASYRRDPLLGTYREGGAGDHVRAVECVRRLDPQVGCSTLDAACYNFLYEIKSWRSPTLAKPSGALPPGSPSIRHSARGATAVARRRELPEERWSDGTWRQPAGRG